jgi:hypothetical protein
VFSCRLRCDVFAAVACGFSLFLSAVGGRAGCRTSHRLLLAAWDLRPIAVFGRSRRVLASASGGPVGSARSSGLRRRVLLASAYPASSAVLVGILWRSRWRLASSTAARPVGCRKLCRLSHFGACDSRRPEGFLRPR